jgi:hypothetical protein
MMKEHGNQFWPSESGVKSIRLRRPPMTGGEQMAISMNWGALGLGSVVAFIIGWWLFGLLGAVILAIIVLFLMGILKFK